ncbi:MAG: flagellar assembly protein FliW [Planctomycetes bacterium]|nr:flagellar assembly protein FliW [Planctomycetota bacterium]
MDVSTSRFGTVEVDADRILTFPSGLLGFSNYQRYALLQPNSEGVFLWLQCIECPDLAFVVTDPSLFVTGYEVPIRRDQMDALDLKSLDDAQVLVIVNRYAQHLTGNLQGPLVINVETCFGRQLVLADQRWTTRYKLLDLGASAAQAASA